MKFLITGATGLVGRALTVQLLAEGHSYNFLTTRKQQLDSDPQGKGFYWNVKEGVLDESCFQGVDCIIHLAGASISKRWTKAYKKEILDSRVAGTELLANGLKTLEGKHQVKQLIAASAVGIYPSSTELLKEEDAQQNPQTFMEKVVFYWEQSMDRFSELGIGIAKIRIGLVLAQEGGVLATLKIPTQLGLGAAFGNGKQGQSWIHITDLVNLFMTAANARWTGIYNAVAPNPVSQKNLMKALAKALKRPYFMPPLPGFFITMLTGEMSALVLESHWISAQKVIDKGFVFLYPELEASLQDIYQKTGK